MRVVEVWQRESAQLPVARCQRTRRPRDLVDHPKVLKLVALSGGYSRQEANDRLARNLGMVASFSRALVEDLSIDQDAAEFDAALGAAIAEICAASAT